MDADEAEKTGMVARIFTQETLLDEAKEIAKKIASFSKTGCPDGKRVNQ